jgi:GPH family glycoside/pentoside/hexuronide:cation symporter
VGMIGVWRRASRTQAPSSIPFVQSIRTTFSNTKFLAFVPSVVLFQVGVQMILGVLPYYVKAVLDVAKPGTWVAILTAVEIVSMLASVRLAARIARRSSKRHAYRLAMIGAACVFPLLAVTGLGSTVAAGVQIGIVMALAGVPLAGVYLFPDALTADIIDDDSLHTGMRREAMYYGAGNFVQQAAGSLGPFLLSGLLLLGDTRGDELGLRLVGPFAGMLVLVGYLIFRGYDLPDEVGVPG